MYSPFFMDRPCSKHFSYHSNPLSSYSQYTFLIYYIYYQGTFLSTKMRTSLGQRFLYWSEVLWAPGLPWWLRWWRICLQCGRPGFNPRVKKIPWRRKWQPTPVFLPGKSQGKRSLVGYSPWGHKESDRTERLALFTFHGEHLEDDLTPSYIPHC